MLERRTAIKRERGLEHNYTQKGSGVWTPPGCKACASDPRTEGWICDKGKEEDKGVQIRFPHCASIPS